MANVSFGTVGGTKSPGIGYTISGIDETLKILKGFRTGFQKKAIRLALRAAARPARQALKEELTFIRDYGLYATGASSRSLTTKVKKVRGDGLVFYVLIGSDKTHMETHTLEVRKRSYLYKGVQERINDRGAKRSVRTKSFRPSPALRRLAKKKPIRRVPYKYQHLLNNPWASKTGASFSGYRVYERAERQSRPQFIEALNRNMKANIIAEWITAGARGN